MIPFVLLIEKTPHSVISYQLQKTLCKNTEKKYSGSSVETHLSVDIRSTKSRTHMDG
jgi:hypothetical protein